MDAQLQPDTQAGIEIARLVEQARALGEIDSYHGKRAWTRFNAALRLEATKDPQDPSSCWTISMHNVSLDGFAAWSKTGLERHDTVYVREFASEGERPWLMAVVCHCTHGIRGFLIGAEFVEKVVPTEHDDVLQQEAEDGSAPPGRTKAQLKTVVRRYRDHGCRQR